MNRDREVRVYRILSDGAKYYSGSAFLWRMDNGRWLFKMCDFEPGEYQFILPSLADAPAPATVWTRLRAWVRRWRSE